MLLFVIVSDDLSLFIEDSDLTGLGAIDPAVLQRILYHMVVRIIISVLVMLGNAITHDKCYYKT
jgi:hypothetical protein